MNDPIGWTEADVQSLITNQVQESLTLDYKRSDALGRSDGKKSELSKDFSAFANSAGGVLLYGIEEDKHIPTRIDGGIDPTCISKEWIEQVANSWIVPKIEGLRVNQIALGSRQPRRVLYAIVIPAATYRAPHQAKDKRYYKRYNYESVAMEDYEIRDVYHRAIAPDLVISLSFTGGKSATADFKYGSGRSVPIPLLATIRNNSREPCFYSCVRVFVDDRLSLVGHGGFALDGQALLVGQVPLKAYYKNFAIPHHLPIFSEMPLSLFEVPFSFLLEEAVLQVPEFYIGYDIRAPGFSRKMLTRLIQFPPGTLSIADNGAAEAQMFNSIVL
jgi:hypothetical protein